MTKKFLIICNNGFSEVQLSTIRENLIRYGYDVDIAAYSKENHVNSMFNLKIIYDYSFTNIINLLKDYLGLFICDGSGIDNLNLLNEIDIILDYFFKNNKIIAAIGQTPKLLAERKILFKKKAICYPSKSLQTILIKNDAIISKIDCKTGEDCAIVIDDNIITGLNTDSIWEFSKKLINLLK